MPAKPRKTALPGRLVGYARVSTEEQGTDPQLDELRAAGCETVLEEHASGADRTRPVLARLLREIRPGETLVVVRLDRLARSVSHLLAVIEQLEANGAHFRSLHDPIDTSTPQGMFSLQVLGAVAQLERALIVFGETWTPWTSVRGQGGRDAERPARVPDPGAHRGGRCALPEGHAGNPANAGRDRDLDDNDGMRSPQPTGAPWGTARRRSFRTAERRMIA